MPGLNVKDLDDKAFDSFRKRAAKSELEENSVLQESNDSLLHHLNLCENGTIDVYDARNHTIKEI